MRRFFILLVALALALAACGGDDEGDATATTAAAASETTEANAEQTETTAAETTTTAAAETTTTTTVAETTTTTAAAVIDESSPLYAALAQTNEVTSGRMEGEIVMVGVEGLPAESEFAITFSGEFDYATGDSSIVMDMSSLMDMAPEGEEIPPGFEDLFGDMEIRTIGDTAYMKFGMFAMFGVETEWVSMSAEDAGSTAGSFGAAPSNPTDLIGEFGEDVEIEELGSETVRGVNTTHYRMIVDMAEMMAEADPEALEELESMGPISADGTMPIEFWVGDDGYLYRILMEFTGDTDAADGFGSMRMLWEMFDYGADIVIEAPPADQVTDGEALSGFFTG